MATNGTEPENCAVCGRGILKGELTYEYVTPAGETRDVCALCRPSAEYAGWLPPGRLVESATRPPRERRRGWRPAFADLLRRQPAGSPTRPAGRRDQSVATAPERAAPPVARQHPRPRPENGLSAALANFNSGEMPRMIAGLCRSLGEAKAEVRPTIDGDGIVLTVAWELSWYSWEVTRSEVREVGKGAEISERPGPEPVWNAQVEQDGRLTIVDRA